MLHFREDEETVIREEWDAEKARAFDESFRDARRTACCVVIFE